MSGQIFFVLFALFLIWLLILSYFFWQLFQHYNSLTKGAYSKTLKEILDQILKETESVKTDIDFLKKYCDTIQKDSFSHIQNIGLIRFNPFKDTGGDQSFILSLTDGKKSGVIISGLYSRSGTRWYAKKIKEGKGVDHELSDEEKKALK